MKLVLLYTYFNGFEQFEHSFSKMKDLVDEVVFCYQRISNTGNFNDDLDLKALLALSAHKFYLKSSGKSWDPSIYSALYLANKSLLKPSEYFHNYNSEAVNAVHFMPLSNSIASIDDDGNLIVSDPSNISARPIKFNQQK